MKRYLFTLGTFDGLHIGHRAVLRQALRVRALTPVVFTFDLPPKFALSGQPPRLLMPPQEKKDELLRLGFAQVFSQAFEDLRSLSATDFLDRLCSTYPVGGFLCGFNYRFGKDASGDAALLSAYCERHGLFFQQMPPVLWKNKTVSSSAIRDLLENGEMQQAGELLGRPFSFCQIVSQGDRRGRTIGFPTVNQNYPPQLVLPKFGVYATFVKFGETVYPSVTNLGLRPTFHVDQPLCETNIASYDGNLYGKPLRIWFKSYLRPERKFDSLQALRHAIEQDLKKSKTL